MILFAVGTLQERFDRLVILADKISSSISEEVFVQFGTSSYIPIHAHGLPYVSVDRMQELVYRCRVMVCQASVGLCILAMQNTKPLILIPRQKKLREVVDDHQFQLAIELERNGRAIMLIDPDPHQVLDSIINSSNSYIPPINNIPLVAALRKRLEDWNSNLNK
jgi:UDP-N-acetylglucosamine transferase subunit ALG13